MKREPYNKIKEEPEDNLRLESEDDKAVLVKKNRNQLLKEILPKYSALILVNSITTSSDFTKIYLLAQFGVRVSSLSATSLTTTITNLTINTAAALTDQSVVLIAEEYGIIRKINQNINQENSQQSLHIAYRNIGGIIRQSWGIGIVASIPIIIILFSIKPILKTFGQSEEVSTLAQSYFFPVAFAVPLKILLTLHERILPAVNKEKWLIPFRILMVFVGTGLSVVFIPKYGMAGLGYAYSIQSLIEFLTTVSFMVCDKDLRAYEVCNFSLRSSTPYFGYKIIKQGFPLVAQQFIMTGSGFVVSLFLGIIGDTRQAIELVVNQYVTMVTAATKGICEGSNRLIAQAMGKRDYKNMRLHGNIALASSISLYCTTGLIYNLFPFSMASAFLDDDIVNQSEDVIRYTFILVTVGRLFDVIQEVSSSNLAGMQDTLLASLSLLVTALAMVLPLSAISLYLTDFNIYGINVSIMIGFSTAAAVALRHWWKLSNKAVEQNDFDPAKETSNVRCLVGRSNFFRPAIKLSEIDDNDDKLNSSLIVSDEDISNKDVSYNGKIVL